MKNVGVKKQHHKNNKIIFEVIDKKVIVKFYKNDLKIDTQIIDLDKNFIKNLKHEEKRNHIKNPKYYLLLTNDDNNVIYDILTIPTSLKKKHIKKAIDNLISQKYVHLNKNEYLQEYKEISNQGETKVILIKFIKKSLLKHFIDLEKIYTVTSDVELINKLDDKDNKLFINYNNSYITILGYNDIGLKYFNKIQRKEEDYINGNVFQSLTNNLKDNKSENILANNSENYFIRIENKNEESILLRVGDNNDKNSLDNNEILENTTEQNKIEENDLIEEVEIIEDNIDDIDTGGFALRHMTNFEIKEIDNYIKALFFESDYKPENIVILRYNDKNVVEELNDYTSLNIEIKSNAIFDILLNEKNKKNIFSSYINKYLYKNVLYFLLTLILTVESGVFLMSMNIDKNIDKLTQEQRMVQSSLNSVNESINNIKTQIENAKNDDYYQIISKVNEYKTKKMSSILYLIPTITTKTLNFTEISVSEDGKVVLKGESNNYSDIGFFVYYLKKYKNNVNIKSITGEVGNLKFEIEIEFGV